MLCKKGVLRNFTKFTGKHLCQGLFFNKVAGLRPATSSKKRLWHRCFLVGFVKFLRTPFFMEHLWWLLLRLFSFKMKKYVSFVEMNMIPITIPKAQLLQFVTLIYWKILLLFKHFFPYKQILPAMCFFLWLFNPFEYRDIPQHMFISSYRCSIQILTTVLT